MSKQELKQKGFTIIEVVLVLAIAALIFLMVFIALPALQRNQRDQARKTVQAKVVTAITTYQSTHRGAQFTKVDDLLPYLDATRADNVNGYALELARGNTGDGGATEDKIVILNGAKCDEMGEKAVPGSNRTAAVLVQLENGKQMSCQSS